MRASAGILRTWLWKSPRFRCDHISSEPGSDLGVDSIAHTALCLPTCPLLQASDPSTKLANGRHFVVSRPAGAVVSC